MSLSTHFADPLTHRYSCQAEQLLGASECSLETPAFSEHDAAASDVCFALCAEEKMNELRSKFHPHHPAKAKQHKHLHPNNKKRTGVC